MDGQLPGEFAIRTYLSDTFLTAINGDAVNISLISDSTH